MLCELCQARLRLANRPRSRKIYGYIPVILPIKERRVKQAMPRSSDPSPKKSGKQRKTAVRLLHLARTFIDGLTDHREVQSPSPSRRTGRSAAHRTNLTRAAEQATYGSISNNALIHVPLHRHRRDTDPAPPSYNDDASSASNYHDEHDERASISSEHVSQRSPHDDTREERDTHRYNYQDSTHTGDNTSTNITYPKHVVSVTGPQFVGDAASSKMMMDFLEKFLNEQLKIAREPAGNAT